MSGFITNDFRKGSGLIVEHLQGAATIAAYSVVYLDGNGQWAAADADAVATMSVVGLCTEALRLNQKGRVVLVGLAGTNTWAWTTGAMLYASTTAGGLTETAPTATGDLRQAVAQAVNATTIYFNPSLASVDSLGMFNYEERAEPITEPTIAQKGNGHTVLQYYTDGQNRSFLWSVTNNLWRGVELL